MAALPEYGEQRDSEFIESDHHDPEFEPGPHDKTTELPNPPFDNTIQSAADPATVISAVPRMVHQTILPGASFPASGSKKKGDRCALCVSDYCLKRHECPGKGKRSLCMCGHPTLTTNKARISEEKILTYWAEQPHLVGRSFCRSQHH